MSRLAPLKSTDWPQLLDSFLASRVPVQSIMARYDSDPLFRLWWDRAYHRRGARQPKEGR